MLFCNVEKNYISRKFSSDLICVLLLLKMIMYLISIKPIAGMYPHSSSFMRTILKEHVVLDISS